jgi:hypothetical protein
MEMELKAKGSKFQKNVILRPCDYSRVEESRRFWAYLPARWVKNYSVQVESTCGIPALRYIQGRHDRHYFLSLRKIYLTEYRIGVAHERI